MRHDLLHRSKYLRPRSIVGGAGKFSHIDLVQPIVMDYIFQLEIDSKVQSVPGFHVVRMWGSDADWGYSIGCGHRLLSPETEIVGPDVPECNRARLMDFFQTTSIRKSFEESGHAPFVDVGEV